MYRRKSVIFEEKSYPTFSDTLAGATGMMGAAARGVTAENGYILGIAPRFFDKPGVLYENCSEFIFTETMRERKKLLEEKSDATVVTPGGIGTYEEFFEILTLKQLGRHKKPIAVLNIRGYFDALEELLEGAVEEGFLEKEVLSMYRMFREPEELVRFLTGELEVTP